MRMLCLFVVLAACSERAEPVRTVTPTEPAPAPLASSSQHDLGRELDDAEQSGAWGDVKRRWEGQRVRWTVTRHPALCGSEHSCHVAVFPVGGEKRHGWMPELRFAPGQLAALKAACGGAAPCEVTIEGTVAALEASAELPTNVRLANVRVVERTARR